MREILFNYYREMMESCRMDTENGRDKREYYRQQMEKWRG